MIRINKKLEYALISIKYIAKKHALNNLAPISVREICNEYSIPFDTTSKVLQTLTSYSYIESIKGIHGGYILKANLQDINLYSFMDTIYGKEMQLDPCKTSDKQCKIYSKCNIKNPMKNLNSYIYEQLKNINLNEFIFEEK